MRTLTIVSTTAAIAVLGIAGCGGGSSSGGSGSQPPDPNAQESSPPGDIPDNQAFVAYSPPGGGFSVKVPEGWSRVGKGGAVTFTDKLNAISMKSAAARKAPTVAELRRTELPPQAQAPRVSTVSRPAGRGLRITYLAAAAPNAVTGKAGTDAVE